MSTPFLQRLRDFGVRFSFLIRISMSVYVPTGPGIIISLGK